MSVRDIRQKWPEAERVLLEEGEIVITRDAKPVAKIIPFSSVKEKKRRRFDPQAHQRWLKKFWKDNPRRPSTDEELMHDRAHHRIETRSSSVGTSKTKGVEPFADAVGSNVYKIYPW